MNYNLVITQPAKKDLADILQYISKDLSAPKAANDLLDDILKCYDNNSDYLQKARKYGHFTGYKN